MLGITTIFLLVIGIIGFTCGNVYLQGISLGLLFLIKLRSSSVIDDIKDLLSKEDLD